MERTRNLLAAGLTFGLVVVLQSGCAGTATVTQPTAKPDAIQQSAAKPAIAPDSGILSGKVVETINAGVYTYLYLEKDGKKSWAAVPATTVNVGQEIELRPGTQMGKFTSKTLKRDFNEIVFSPGLVTDTKAAPPSAPLTSDTKTPLPPGHPPMDAKPQGNQGQSAPGEKVMSKKHMGMMEQSSKEMAAISGKVVETMDSGGYTYINLESGGKKVWAAVPTMNVSVGQELELLPGQEMFNFKSKSLNRTFDSVIFSGGAMPVTK
jgi:hypothetical protein